MTRMTNYKIINLEIGNWKDNQMLKQLQTKFKELWKFYAKKFSKIRHSKYPFVLKFGIMYVWKYWMVLKKALGFFGLYFSQ